MQAEELRCEFSVSDHADLGAFQDRLRRVPGVAVSRTAAEPGEGELGVLDVITAVGSSSGLVALIGIIPAYLQSRRPGTTVKVKTKDKTVQITAQNLAEAMRAAEKLLNG